MTKDARIQVDQRNRKYWSAKFNYLFVPRFQGELVLTVFVELDKILWLSKIVEKQEPALKGIYTTHPARAIPPKLELYTSIGGRDVCYTTFPTSLVVDRIAALLKESQAPALIDPTELEGANKNRGHCITCTCSPPPSLPQKIVRDPGSTEDNRLASGTGPLKGRRGRSHSEPGVERTSKKS
jgi:hypothetical protein